jgi:acyl-CoA synthetase (AMP-forming)/AMP-acid ligase II
MMKLPQILQRVAHEFPGQPGITYEGKTRTWTEILQRCERLAGGLAKLGLDKGDRLAILSHNSNRMAELFYGPLWIGVVPVPLNWRWTLPELTPCLEDCTPTALAVDADFVDRGRELAALSPSIKTLIYLGEGEPPAGFVSYEAIVKEGEPVSYCPFGGEDLAVIVYTGGTTGRSKGVMLSHTNLYINATNHMEFDSIGKGASIVLSGPMFHISSCCRVYIHTFMAVHMVILPQFDALALMENIQKYRITSVILISAMAALVLDHPRYREFDLSSLNRINYGAAPMPPSLISRLQQEFPGVGFYHGYGATEASGVISTLPAADHCLDGPNTQRLRSVGRPAAYIELRIVDAGDNEVEPGVVGEVVIRGPNVMQGYLNMPEATAEVLRDDWYHTGDAGYRDEDDYIYLVDRMKDMIISGGENVYSVEVERAIDLHSAIRQCAVIGRPDETWGEVVHAVISLQPGHNLTHEELLAHCHEHIAGYKCPRGLSIWDALPLSGAGKLLKNEIRDRVDAENESADLK